jgi:acyl carrier protein
MSSIEEVVRELLLAHVEDPKGLDQPLELPSLALVTLAEELEHEFSFVVTARDLKPENFSTLARIISFVEGHLS